MDSILDISQVESLMFHKDQIYDVDGKINGQMYYYIPVASDWNLTAINTKNLLPAEEADSLCIPYKSVISNFLSLKYGW